MFNIQVKTSEGPSEMMTPLQDGQDYSMNGPLCSQSCEFLTTNALKDKTRATFRSCPFLFPLFFRMHPLGFISDASMDLTPHLLPYSVVSSLIYCIAWIFNVFQG